MSIKGIEDVLCYFPDLSPIQIEQLRQLGFLYATWNTHLNLISRKDLPNLYERHVLHALSIAKLINFNPRTSLLDVGTGGGFPGIPLAIYFPLAHFHLIDSITKKIKAVDVIVQALGLNNVTTQVVRIESLAHSSYDFVLGRAVTNLPLFYQWTFSKINTVATAHQLANGILYLKGDEGVTLKKSYQIFAISQWFNSPFFKTKQLIHIPI